MIHEGVSTGIAQALQNVHCNGFELSEGTFKGSVL